ncbi:uncharacterized protein LOC120087353 isoform X2 [Benincasa hispida]|uniref:uncharacterized protein LOC120087353 isoform X2 n=1 Tax=Benincasa hispida TaxID=102211 RepID=UPI0019002DCE|nr:uncharacterized protein LOC120087353 isoform X2 [Benincasa hispida]
MEVLRFSMGDTRGAEKSEQYSQISGQKHDDLEMVQDPGDADGVILWRANFDEFIRCLRHKSLEVVGGGNQSWLVVVGRRWSLEGGGRSWLTAIVGSGVRSHSSASGSIPSASFDSPLAFSRSILRSSTFVIIQLLFSFRLWVSRLLSISSEYSTR